MKNIVFDTWPLIAFFESQKSASAVEQILIESHQEKRNLFISVVNAGEIWYTVARAHSKEKADVIIEEIGKLKISIKPVSWEITRTAAEFKYGGGISYADCFAASLAKNLNAHLITGDKGFKLFENELEIVWL